MAFFRPTMWLKLWNCDQGYHPFLPWEFAEEWSRTAANREWVIHGEDILFTLRLPNMATANGGFAWKIGLNRLLPSGSQTWLAGKSMNIPYKGGLKLGTSYKYMGNCPLPCLPEGSTLTRINRLVVCNIWVCVCVVFTFFACQLKWKWWCWWCEYMWIYLNIFQ